VLQVCHPDWRGIRTLTYAFREPVVECDDLSVWGGAIANEAADRGVRCVVIQGWPPGSAVLASRLRDHGVTVKCVLHSSAVQHGGDPAEAAVADEVLAAVREGLLDGLGMAKEGLGEAFVALGYPVSYVPNRAPLIPPVERVDLCEGMNVGVFVDPYWRKNPTTQVLAAVLMGAVRVHLMRGLGNAYLEPVEVVVHGELPYEEFISLQASVDINLYVTLSECHPSAPQESYMTGVPCLMSRTSSVFRSDPVLWDLTTVDELDNPSAVARAALRLLDAREEAVARAGAWIAEADQAASDLWSRFTSGAVSGTHG
jgi:hypothetical protein